jgi:alpha-amylase
MKKLILTIAALLLLTMTATTFVSCGDDDDTQPQRAQQGTEQRDTTKNDSSQTDTATIVNPVPVQYAQGWPAQYGGVMLQGFWWDSYSATRWTELTRQADEMAQYFQLIWIPNSGKTSDFYHSGRQTMGYDPCFWLDHSSCFGTEAELRQMIQTFKANGTGIIADVVVNHKNGLGSWVDFPDEARNGYSITWDNTRYTGICSDDECNRNGYPTAGAKDTGDNFDGYRDLDHTNAQVQKNVRTYLKFLLDDLGYAGFRYDMVKGFSASFVGDYNATAVPTYSVGECWDGNVAVVRNWIDGTRAGSTTPQSAAFDFPMKYKINSAFQNGAWNALSTAMLTTTAGYARYSVTFVDNHDTGKNPANYADGPLSKNVCAANAYILAMPGTPCVWLKHWQNYKGSIKRLIAARRAAGITNESRIVSATASADGFVLQVEGANGNVLLLLGNATADTSNYQLAVSGTNYAYYVSQGVNLSAVLAVGDTDQVDETPVQVSIPSFCTVAQGEMCAFFEVTDGSWTKPAIKCWAWNDTQNFTGGQWPGTLCTQVGTADNGHAVWKWSYQGTLTGTPAGILFNNDEQPQTADFAFVNGGYYTVDGLQGVVTARPLTR